MTQKWKINLSHCKYFTKFKLGISFVVGFDALFSSVAAAMQQHCMFKLDFKYCHRRSLWFDFIHLHPQRGSGLVSFALIKPEVRRN